MRSLCLPADDEVETMPDLNVAAIGSFHVGGRLVRLAGMPERERVSTPGGPVYEADPDGLIVAGQMYVQFVRLAAPRGSCPLLMWHGGGMTGAAWESTPDGRPGWQTFFLRAGFDTYVSRRRGARARVVGAVPADLSRGTLLPHGCRRPGRTPSASDRAARGIATLRCGAPIRD